MPIWNPAGIGLRLRDERHFVRNWCLPSGIKHRCSERDPENFTSRAEEFPAAVQGDGFLPTPEAQRGETSHPAAPSPGQGVDGPRDARGSQRHRSGPRSTVTNAPGTGRGQTAWDGGRWRQQKPPARSLEKEGVLEEMRRAHKPTLMWISGFVLVQGRKQHLTRPPRLALPQEPAPALAIAPPLPSRNQEGIV